MVPGFLDHECAALSFYKNVLTDSKWTSALTFYSNSQPTLTCFSLLDPPLPGQGSCCRQYIILKRSHPFKCLEDPEVVWTYWRGQVARTLQSFWAHSVCLFYTHKENYAKVKDLHELYKRRSQSVSCKCHNFILLCSQVTHCCPWAPHLYPFVFWQTPGLVV